MPTAMRCNHSRSRLNCEACQERAQGLPIGNHALEGFDSNGILQTLLLAGDGIGPEVMGELKAIIAWLNAQRIASFEVEEGLVGGVAYDAHGEAISESDMAKAMASDAVVFGAVGGPKWDGVPHDKRPEAGLLRLRKDLALYANLRPAICYPALADASSLKREVVEGLDLLIVRELTGGVYFGEPKTITDLGNGQKRAIDTQVYDTFEIDRVSRVAFDLARQRRNKVHSAEKRNVMKSGVLWNEVVSRVHRENYRDVELEHILADNCGMQLVRSPKQFDVIVTDNLFGDILSDVAAMLTGSLGMLPSRRSAQSIQERAAEGALRAGPWLGARHRRQGRGQPDCDDRVLRHGAALFLRPQALGRSLGRGDRGGAQAQHPDRRHHAAGDDQGRHEGDGRRDPGGAGPPRRLRGKRSLSFIDCAANDVIESCREEGSGQMGYKVAVVGATGNVGREMLNILAEREFPVDQAYAIASRRSLGTEVSFGDRVLKCLDLDQFDFRGVDFCLMSAGSAVSKEWSPRIGAAGAIVIDNSSCWRYDPEVPLIVPEVNAAALVDYMGGPTGATSSPIPIARPPSSSSC